MPKRSSSEKIQSTSSINLLETSGVNTSDHSNSLLEASSEHGAHTHHNVNSSGRRGSFNSGCIRKGDVDDHVEAAAMAGIEREDAAFAQRYFDEIAPTNKMKEYESIAAKQRASLIKETNTMRKMFSEDMLQSQRIENTVIAISGLVAEFASLVSPLLQYYHSFEHF